MMSISILCISCFFLSGCFRVGDLGIIQTLSARKQKQKIINLEKKLEKAEQVELCAKSEVEELAQEIDEAKVALIRKQIDHFEKVKETPQALFMEEREALYELIQAGPSPSAFEAQVELDRILRIITEQSDEKNLF